MVRKKKTTDRFADLTWDDEPADEENVVSEDIRKDIDGFLKGKPKVQLIDLVDEIALDEDFALKFITRPGEAVFFNNLTVLHNRTAFEDSEIESEKRHLLRLWLVAHRPRPVCDKLRIYEGRGIDRQDGKSTYFDSDLEYSRFDDEDARM